MTHMSKLRQAPIAVTPPRLSWPINCIHPPRQTLLTLSIPPLPHPVLHNASHFHHQERARNRRPPLLLRVCSAPNRGSYRLWGLKTHGHGWRVCKPESVLTKLATGADGVLSDAFTKREAAAEELYIRQEEKAK